MLGIENKGLICTPDISFAISRANAHLFALVRSKLEASKGEHSSFKSFKRI
jgi:hypothetical protein